MPLTLTELGQEWQQHRLGRRRAAGGLNALSGFAYQLAVSLEEFFGSVLSGDDDAALAFETLSDLAAAKGGLYYLTQVKTTLTTATAVDVAKEAMAVDAFLAERYPELREAFSYEVRCRAWTSGDPREVTSKRLGLDDADARRWEEVRGRLLAPSVRSRPELGLALKLFNEVPDPFGLIARMIGELLQLLDERAAPSDIALALLQTLSSAREARRVYPPARILTVEDFVPKPGSDQISLGQRPTINQLASGYFMPRPDRASDVARCVEEYVRSARDHDALTVCWLSGGSGAGKSVLLLQAQEQLYPHQRLVQMPTNLLQRQPKRGAGRATGHTGIEASA
jgi:hypothetical protein